MKIFRKNTDYAVRTLIYLALQDDSNYISSTDLAGELGLPLNYLRRICSVLIKGKVLETREGAGGGVRLAKIPDDINLLDLIELLDGKPELTDCTFRKKLCPNRKTCPLRRRVLGIEETVNQELTVITIQTLLDDIKK